MSKKNISTFILSFILAIALASGVWTFILKQSINSIKEDFFRDFNNPTTLSQESLLTWVLDSKMDSIQNAIVLLQNEQPELSQKLQAYIDKQNQNKKTPYKIKDQSNIEHFNQDDDLTLDDMRTINKGESEKNSIGAMEKATAHLKESEALTNSIDTPDDTSYEVQQLSFKLHKNNIYYNGEIYNGKANGTGKGVFDNGSVYEGSWRDNKPHGKGVQVWPDGRKYQGEFSNGLKSGQGTFTWSGKDRYTGEWLNDVRHGVGIYYDRKGKVKHKGEWRSDVFIK